MFMKEGHSDIVLFGEILNFTMYALMEFKDQSDLLLLGVVWSGKVCTLTRILKGLDLCIWWLTLKTEYVVLFFVKAGHSDLVLLWMTLCGKVHGIPKVWDFRIVRYGADLKNLTCSCFSGKQATVTQIFRLT